MSVNRTPIFDAVRQLRGGRGWVQPEVDLLDRAIDKATGEVTDRFRTRPAPAPVLVTPAPVAGGGGPFGLSQTSLKKMEPLKPELRQCIELAITLSAVDFGVGQVERSRAQQAENVAKGTSRTMKSKHLRQPDGLVWAADLHAYVASKISWDLKHYAQIAEAMDKAAHQLGIADHVRWGCAWDRVLSDFGGHPEAYYAEILAYAKRHPGSDLLDGPHFEWVP